MNNRDDEDIRSHIEYEISQLQQQITRFENRRDYLVKMLDQPIRKLISFTKSRNYCLVQECHSCDYCFAEFEWGDAEFHYHDAEGLDICSECVEQNIIFPTEGWGV
jgi:hypothetical protein